MNIISENKGSNTKLSSIIDKFFKEFKIGALLKDSNFYKSKGIACSSVFKFIFLLLFSGKSFTRTLNSQDNYSKFGKDVVYRFLNSTSNNWRKFLLLLSTSVITKKIESLTNDDRVNVFIVDDSFFNRSRSKHVELLSKVRDHTDGKYKRGFRMLTVGWSDGNSFIPVAFSLLSSAKKKNRICEANEDVDKRSNGYKLRLEAISKSTEVMFTFLKQAISSGVKADYILFDSWFAYPKTITNLAALNLKTIAMIKKTSKIHYLYNGKKQSVKSIYKSLKKRRGKAKILTSAVVTIGEDNNGNPIEAKIIFVRDRNRSKQWLALITTDLDLSNEEAIRIYGKRWGIEVFFKVLKSYLKLTKEFSGLSYDCMVAHTSIVFTRYIMLSIETRKNKDHRTLGDLFHLCCDELDDIKFLESINLLLTILEKALLDQFLLTKEQLNEFMDYFISLLPCVFKEKMAIL